ncbi:helix-turn-helix domain-containing protein [Modestobacter sp. SSW1-42]|uniref:helix-turn-helix domain-containing protein n=1 Tax=Modestobacter sp. SSW1-42 TaxID=596372 RepID=UPI003987EB93
MTAALTGNADRLQLVRELYKDGLSLRQVAARVGVAHTTVRRLLEGAGVTIRQRHLRVVPDAPRAAQGALDVPPADAAIAYTADRGWHMVQAPPGWFLELLAELA